MAPGQVTNFPVSAGVVHAFNTEDDEQAFGQNAAGAR